MVGIPDAIEDGSNLNRDVNDQRAIDSVGIQTFPSSQQVAAGPPDFNDVVDCNLRGASLGPACSSWNRGNGIRTHSACDPADQSVHTATRRGMVRWRDDAVFRARRRLRARSSIVHWTLGCRDAVAYRLEYSRSHDGDRDDGRVGLSLEDTP